MKQVSWMKLQFVLHQWNDKSGWYIYGNWYLMRKFNWQIMHESWIYTREWGMQKWYLENDPWVQKTLGKVLAISRWISVSLWPLVDSTLGHVFVGIYVELSDGYIKLRFWDGGRKMRRKQRRRNVILHRVGEWGSVEWNALRIFVISLSVSRSLAL